MGPAPWLTQTIIRRGPQATSYVRTVRALASTFLFGRLALHSAARSGNPYGMAMPPFT